MQTTLPFTYDIPADRARLVERLRLYMQDGTWWTNERMALALGCQETGATARMRDLRKEQYGGHRIIKRKRGGIYEYKLIG